MAKQIQDDIIDEMKNVILNLRVGNSKSHLPFQQGILTSSVALPMLFQDLLKDYKISTDIQIESGSVGGIFWDHEVIGGLHDHPTALEFKYRLRNYLLGRNETIMSQSMNVKQNDVENSTNVFKDMPIDFEYANNFETADEPSTISSCLLQQLQQITSEPQITAQTDFESTLTEIEYDGIENIAGYIAFKLRGKESLGAPTSQQVDPTFSWADQLSEGGLYKPNPDFLKKIYELEQIFFNYNGSELKCVPNFIKTLINNSKHINCSVDVNSTFFQV